MAARFGATIVPFAAVRLQFVRCSQCRRKQCVKKLVVKRPVVLLMLLGLLCRQVGCDDSFNMVFDSQDVINLPFIGSRVKEQALRIPSARQGIAAKEDIPDDLFIQPVSVPKSINRCTAPHARDPHQLHL